MNGLFDYRNATSRARSGLWCARARNAANIDCSIIVTPLPARTLVYGARGHDWLLIQPVARQMSTFSRPPYFTAGVNLTAEFPSEPPRGGELGAGAK